MTHGQTVGPPRPLAPVTRHIQYAGARGYSPYSYTRGMGPLRGRRHRVAVGRLALERLLDGTRTVEHAVRREALRVVRHKGARRRADRVVRRVGAALLRGARVAPQAARAVRQQAAEATIGVMYII